ncbi:TatD family hydrolase [Alloscardovia macacae]|uniref:Hydrolase TatD n=1 Tax=Alloscardovia macacae TaxID=1160091 RepID=A0A261F6S1_9BIFI|nr:TatD family hydrolase [Alloscardovia macacae]OZG54832.1 hydrolase TatD [Alloscardovia macacae]
MAKKHRSRAWAEAPERLAAPIIDNHTHIASVVQYAMSMSAQAAQRHMPDVPVYGVEGLIQRAQAVGVAHMVDVGCELPNLERAVNLAKQYPDVMKAAIAIHPNESVLHGHRGASGPDGLDVRYKPWHDVSFEDALARVHALASQSPDDVVAIGETGLDYFRTGEEARAAQREAFRAHISLAKELGLALQIHDRDAHEDVIDILLKDGAPERTVFHSFSADAAVAEIANEHGWYLSFSGTLTYKANERLREALRILDRRHILIETDAPYLTPEPYRGRTNASYLTPYTLRVMADVLGLSEEETARLTFTNTVDAYGLPYVLPLHGQMCV